MERRRSPRSASLRRPRQAVRRGEAALRPTGVGAQQLLAAIGAPLRRRAEASACAILRRAGVWTPGRPCRGVARPAWHMAFRSARVGDFLPLGADPGSTTPRSYRRAPRGAGRGDRGVAIAARGLRTAEEIDRIKINGRLRHAARVEGLACARKPLHDARKLKDVDLPASIVNATRARLHRTASILSKDVPGRADARKLDADTRLRLLRQRGDPVRKPGASRSGRYSTPRSFAPGASRSACRPCGRRTIPRAEVEHPPQGSGHRGVEPTHRVETRPVCAQSAIATPSARAVLGCAPRCAYREPGTAARILMIALCGLVHRRQWRLVGVVVARHRPPPSRGCWRASREGVSQPDGPMADRWSSPVFMPFATVDGGACGRGPSCSDASCVTALRSCFGPRPRIPSDYWPGQTWGKAGSLLIRRPCVAHVDAGLLGASSAASWRWPAWLGACARGGGEGARRRILPERYGCAFGSSNVVWASVASSSASRVSAA